MKSSSRILIVVLIIVGLIAVVTFLNRQQKSDNGLVNEVKRTQHPVHTVVLKPVTVTERIEHTGALEANRDVTLTSQVSGKLVRKNKDWGERCQQGEILLQLEAESYQIALLQAEGNLQQGEVQLTQAQRELKRTTQLAARSTVAGQTLERAQSAVQAAEAVVKQADAAVRLNRRNLRETTVRCPFSGVIAESLVELGQIIAPQVPLARLVQTDQLKMRLQVPAAEFARLKVGQPARLTDADAPGEIYRGQVTRLGVAADQLTHTFPAEVTVPSAAGPLRPGRVLRVAVEVATHTDVLRVPDEALDYEQSQPRVLLARSGKAQPVAVTPGARFGGQTILREGVRTGDEVIIVGHKGLKAGQAVEIVGRRGGAPTATPPTADNRQQPTTGPVVAP